MRKLTAILGVIIFVSILAASCSSSLSTNELAEEVETLIREEMKERGVDGDIEIISFMLIHKEGNEYSGVIKIKEEGEIFTSNVDVIYDGKNIKWEIE